MVTMDNTVSAGKDQVSVDLSNESVILHAPSGSYFGLDEVGQRIWQLLKDPLAVREIHQTLLVEFDVEPQRCESDLLAFLNDLESQGLISVDGTAS